MAESAICIELVFMAFLLGTVVALKIQISFWLDEPANDSTFHRSWSEEACFAKSYLRYRTGKNTLKDDTETSSFDFLKW
jgi:hypothetical protein